jgi:hypothetical protein
VRLLSGELVEGGTVLVDREGDGLAFRSAA